MRTIAIALLLTLATLGLEACGLCGHSEPPAPAPLYAPPPPPPPPVTQRRGG